MSDESLRILILEDSPADATLLERELRRGGLVSQTRVVETRDDFLREIAEFRPDVILSDYSLPSFDGLSALAAVRARNAEVPYIFVSGSIGEERAVEALRHGATDYILKGQYARLVPAIRNAISVVREREELRRLEGQLRQSQKMEAVGQLAGGIAHDFNNLLTVINGYSDLLLSDMDADDPRRASIELIHDAGARAAALTRQLLAFGRKTVVAPRVLDLNAAVADVERLLRRVIGEDIVMVTSLAPDLGHVRIDPGQLEQVLMNLAVNARDAMPAGGHLTIETRNVVLDESYARSRVAVRPGPHVRLSITDDGAGMDDDTMAHIFEPFFTTKGMDKGTGLGLATVYGIVTQAGGHVAVTSRPGEGTTMAIHLPRSDEPVDLHPRGASRPAPGGTETLLLVEDEDAVRALLEEVLRSKGYTVLAARNGQEALDLLEDPSRKVRLMVSDVVMPGMSGEVLAGRVRALSPGTRVLFLSGYAGGTVMQRGLLGPAVEFLQKPCSPDLLARRVREILDR